MKIEKIKIIVREHLLDDPFEKEIEEISGIKLDVGSTVAVKVVVDGKQYGTFVSCKPPTLSASEIEEAVNLQFENLIEEICKEITEGKNYEQG